MEFVGRFPGRDDDEIASALRIRPRQTVNQACRSLVREGLIERRSNERGKLGNYPLARGGLSSARKTDAVPFSATSSMHVPTDWFWEGNVVDRLAAHLEKDGWSIVRRANSLTRERGIDLQAERAGQTLLVEAKGYPSTEYGDPARAGQRKPTNPSLQAQHWFAQGLLKALRLQSQDQAATVALAFPDFPRYRALVAETEGALSTLGGLDVLHFRNRRGRTPLIHMTEPGPVAD